MKLVEVDSSAVHKVGYNGDTLFVQYVGGKWYKYLQVPETVFEQFLAAPSKGLFVNKNVKPFYRDETLTNQELEIVRRKGLPSEMPCPIR